MDKIREQYKNETGVLHVHDNGMPTIRYTSWLEKKIESMAHESVLADVRAELNKKAFGIDNKYHSWVVDVEDVMEILIEHFS